MQGYGGFLKGLGWIRSNLQRPCKASSCHATFSRVVSVPSTARQRGNQWGVNRGFKSSSVCLVFFALLGCLRVGEATNPGPDHCDKVSWQFGIFNASGLNSKTDQIANLSGQAWVSSETHLTAAGVKQLKRGLGALKSNYKFLVPGEPCKARGPSSVGTFAGVLLISQFPSRKLPHDFDADLMATSRIQVAGMFVSGYWVQMGMCYGYPAGASHQQPLEQTEFLLDALITRIGCQSQGPRIICGDLNHDPASISQCERLRDLGFREVQELASFRWGIPEQPTGRGKSKIDQIWISSELQSILASVEVLPDQWADHAAVVARFANDPSPLYEYKWFMPQQFKWPHGDSIVGHYDTTVAPGIAYAAMWKSFEDSASTQLIAEGKEVSHKVLGRGQTLDVRATLTSPAPCKLARQGDLQPGYLGTSIKHSQWFRQLRRVQALLRMSRCSNPKPDNHIKMVELWSAIRNASGFDSGFGLWWKEHGKSSVFPDGLPLLLPSTDQISQLFQDFQKHVNAFEKTLAKKKYHSAKDRRQNDLNYVFQDCKREAPEKVDTLIQSKSAIVEKLHPDDMAVSFSSTVGFDPNLPLVGEGQVYHIIESHQDQVWLADIEGLSPGSEVRQEVVECSDADILARFEQVWKPRWVNYQHVSLDQWNTIFAFAANKLPALSWDFPEWSIQYFQSSLSSKKARSATGPDGVSKQDLQSLGESGISAILSLYKAVENGSSWPPQVATGFVSSLNKQRGDGGVDSYRPVTVYSMIYRVWSSARAKSALKTLSKWLPNSVRGGVPSRQAKSVWYELAQLIESAHCTNTSLQGILVDIKRAFNALPRLPIWKAMKCLNFPRPILLAWANFVSMQQRRFRVRNSTGKGLQSCVGYPEGCAMSVFAMTIIDWLFELWVQSQVVHPTSVLSYVDDWQTLFGRPADFQLVWDSIVSFADCLDLEVDVNKSCLWAAHSEDRSVLKRHPLGTVLSARDLGAHQNFCRRSGNATVTSRILELKPFWKKLRLSLSPLRAKLQALIQAAWPRSLHAISVVHLGHHHYVSLRSSAAYGLKCRRVGSNPIALLATFPQSCDPELWAISQTIRDARELSCHQQIETMLACLSQSDEAIPSNGPTMALARRLARLGWQLVGNGFIRDDFGVFSIFASHWDAIQRRIRWSWPKVIASELNHRTTFSGIQYADIEELHQTLIRFSEADQTYLRCNLDGTLFIDQHRTKAERQAPRVCAACGKPDSFFHQHWECTATQSCRENFPWPELVDVLPACLVNHGWPVVSLAWLELQRHFESLPDLSLDVSECNLPGTMTLDFFVDGSVSFPGSESLDSPLGLSPSQQARAACGSIKWLLVGMLLEAIRLLIEVN